ncbi:methyl-accepting chemotaxis protein [Clostridium sp. SHJSY1]|uniref:methyl-accepting chemotaxis protein n=1 Tax=Clostridium sp. SHJSY1 TaxID=2942483 RepID=UPI002876F60F|nr:methyl-accepting chemotaxis protein [Clostridium sp. SHJSY1]MDS0525601.1 methyl-accepting chemotaxis protein [Clostridium sp. SHJSY1]
MKKIGTKIVLMAITIVFSTAFIIGAVVTTQNYYSNKEMLETLRSTMNDNFDAKIKEQVENAISMLDGVNKRYEKGEITLSQAKELGANLLRGLKYGNGGYFWADTEDGTNVVLNGTPTEGTNRMNLLDSNGYPMIKNIIATGMKDGGGYTDYYFPKKGETTPLPKRGYSLEFKPFGWIVGTGNYVDDIDTLISAKNQVLNDTLKRNLLSLVGIIAVMIVFASISAIYFSRIITNPILFLTKLVNKTSALDLEYDPSFEKLGKYKDEIGIISNSVINLRKELRNIVNLIKQDSKEIFTFAEELNSETERTVSSIKEVTLTIEELAKGATSQAKDAQEGAENLSVLANEIDISVDRTKEVENFSKKIKDVNLDGKETLKKLKDRLKENNESSREVSKNIGTLANKSASIGEIVGSIEGIASQTNLLALNAAIEAARAGELGKGFAVVADEVKTLSEMTTQATQEIATVINEIQKEIDVAKNSMNIGEGILKDVNTAMKETDVAFDSIGESIENAILKISELTENIEKVGLNKNEIVHSVEAISAISQESAAATEEISASMDEQHRIMENITYKSSSLKGISNSLQEVISKIKL